MQLQQYKEDIYHEDFEQLVKSNGLEVYHEGHVQSLINQLGSVIEKSEGVELTEDDKAKENLIKSELLLNMLINTSENIESKMWFRWN